MAAKIAPGAQPAQGQALAAGYRKLGQGPSPVGERHPRGTIIYAYARVPETLSK